MTWNLIQIIDNWENCSYFLADYLLHSDIWVTMPQNNWWYLFCVNNNGENDENILIIYRVPRFLDSYVLNQNIDMDYLDVENWWGIVLMFWPDSFENKKLCIGSRKFPLNYHAQSTKKKSKTESYFVITKAKERTT